MVNETASGNFRGYWNAIVHTIKLFIESPNHRTVWAERDLLGEGPSRSCCSWHCSAEFEQIQSPEMEIPQIFCTVCTTGKNSVFIPNLNFLCCNFCLLHVALSLCTWDVSGSVIFLSAQQVFVESSKISTSTFSSSSTVSSIFAFISCAPVPLSTCWTWPSMSMSSFCPGESRTGHRTPDVPNRVSPVPNEGEGSLPLTCC